MLSHGGAPEFAPARLPEARKPREGVVRSDRSVMRGQKLIGRWHPTMMYDVVVTVKEEQRRRLEATIVWAAKIRANLQPLQDAHGDRVHFRPSSKGVAMVGLLHERPQRGKSKIVDLAQAATEFETMFTIHCCDVAHGKATGEKALQSFLIRESYKNGRHLRPINTASIKTNAPVDLVFVTDEIALPVEGGKTVCDLLALRRDGRRSTPVLLELKDRRSLTRLVEQVEGYSVLIDAHADLFAKLFGALLGEHVRFDGPTEKWIVWPAAGDEQDPREEELRTKGIRVVGYTGPSRDRYVMRVGHS